MDDGVDGATEYETAVWTIGQHETGRCPQCDGGGCWLLDWALNVRTTTEAGWTADATVAG